MTESAFFASAAQQKAFSDLDVELYEIVATLDMNTSEICQELDGKVFDMKDYQVGVSAPPFHPWCRSVTAPYFEDDDDSMRAARGADGQTYYVDGKTKYADWYDKFVEGGSKAKLPKVVVPDPADLSAIKQDFKNRFAKINPERLKALEREDYQVARNLASKENDLLSLEKDLKKFDDSRGFTQEMLDDINKKHDQLLKRFDEEMFNKPARRTPERELWNQKYGHLSLDEIAEEESKLYREQDRLLKERGKIQDALNFRKMIDYDETKKQFDELSKEVSDLKRRKVEIPEEIKWIEKETIVLKKEFEEFKGQILTAEDYKNRTKQMKEVLDIKGFTEEEDLKDIGSRLRKDISPRREELLLKKQEITEKMKKNKYREYDQELDNLRSTAVRNDEYWDKQSELISKKLSVKDEYWKLHEQLVEIEKDYYGKPFDNAKELKEKLSEVREMGIKNFDVDGHLERSRSPMRKVVKNAYDYYPTEWVDNSIKRGTLTPKKVNRGYYSDYRKEIAISGYSDEHSFSTAIHELGHRFERAVPRVADYEATFYNRRTAGETAKWLGSGYDKSEVSKFDNFIDKYIGKDYGGNAYEVVSMGFQYAYTEPTRLWTDDDFADFIYGILSLE